MGRPGLCFLCLLCLAVSGCTAQLRPESPQPVFYALDSKPAVFSCPNSFRDNLRVWEFFTSSPYNRTGMAVVNPSGEIVFSNTHQWADLPGIMVAEVLQRDLGRSGLFPLVFLGLPSIASGFELSGRVHELSCRQSQEGRRAVLKADVSLMSLKQQPRLLLSKTYTLRSQPLTVKTSSKFAQAVDNLVRELSLHLQEDLCRVAARPDDS